MMDAGPHPNTLEGAPDAAPCLVRVFPAAETLRLAAALLCAGGTIPRGLRSPFPKTKSGGGVRLSLEDGFAAMGMPESVARPLRRD